MELYHYDPETGQFTRRVAMGIGRRHPAGGLAGTYDNKPQAMPQPPGAGVQPPQAGPPMNLPGAMPHTAPPPMLANAPLPNFGGAPQPAPAQDAAVRGPWANALSGFLGGQGMMG